MKLCLTFSPLYVKWVYANLKLGGSSMPIFKTLDVPDNVKHAIVSGISTAITNDIPDIISDYKLPTNNGIGQFRWNFIHRRVEENLGGRFQHSYVSRGPWKILILFESVLGFTFSIMSESNLSRLKMHLPDGIHYSEALLSKNVGYDVIHGQMCLERFKHQRSPSDVEKLRDTLLKDFVGIVKNHILILFDYMNHNITSSRAVLLTPEYNIAFEEDWSNYLQTPYIIGKSSIFEDMINDDTEPLVRFKQNVQLVSEESIVSLPTKLMTVNN